MKVYTKIGDGGHTQFFGCGLVRKDDPRIETLGTFDELNSIIGLAISFSEDSHVTEKLTNIQHTLFQLGADLIGSALKPDSLPRIRQEHVDELEQEIDLLHDRLGIPTTFILPGGTKESSLLHLCRTITRRAERCLVNVKNSGVIPINPEMLCYVNRLSDYLYMLARDKNNEVKVEEQQPIYNYFKEGDNNVK